MKTLQTILTQPKDSHHDHIEFLDSSTWSPTGPAQRSSAVIFSHLKILHRTRLINTSAIKGQLTLYVALYKFYINKNIAELLIDNSSSSINLTLVYRDKSKFKKYESI